MQKIDDFDPEMDKKATILARKKRFSAELKRLNKIFAHVDPKRFHAVEALIQTAADLRVRIEEARQDIDENGYVEAFQQKQDFQAYERERPVVKRLNAMEKNLITVIKELVSYLPKEVQETISDGFDEFVATKPR